jgi:DNA-binding NarL/FixJ family response regulator
MPINIAIVEDDSDLRKNFEAVVNACDDFFFVRGFSNAEDFQKEFSSMQQLDVVLMDINLPGMTGTQCISELKPKRPGIQYLVCTIFEDNDNLFNALCAGATGYILKSSTDEELRRAMMEIHGGGSPMSPPIARLVLSAVPRKKTNAALLEQLNQRERAILDLLAEGYRYKEIGDKLFLGVETVRTYIRNIYSKLHVHSRTDALNKAFNR